MDAKHWEKSKIEKVTYDKESDVLYISYGKSRPGIAFEAAPGNLIRIDPYTDEVVGITIIDFKEKYSLSPTENLMSFAKGICPKILEAIDCPRCEC